MHLELHIKSVSLEKFQIIFKRTSGPNINATCAMYGMASAQNSNMLY